MKIINFFLDFMISFFFGYFLYKVLFLLIYLIFLPNSYYFLNLLSHSIYLRISFSLLLTLNAIFLNNAVIPEHSSLAILLSLIYQVMNLFVIDIIMVNLIDTSIKDLCKPDCMHSIYSLTLFLSGNI